MLLLSLLTSGMAHAGTYHVLVVDAREALNRKLGPLGGVAGVFIGNRGVLKRAIPKVEEGFREAGIPDAFVALESWRIPDAGVACRDLAAADPWRPEPQVVWSLYIDSSSATLGGGFYALMGDMLGKTVDRLLTRLHEGGVEAAVCYPITDE